MLSNAGRDVEFRVEVDAMSGKYSVTPSELLELKGRAAKLFTQQPGPPADAPPAAGAFCTSACAGGAPAQHGLCSPPLQTTPAATP